LSKRLAPWGSRATLKPAQVPFAFHRAAAFKPTVRAPLETARAEFATGLRTKVSTLKVRTARTRAAELVTVAPESTTTVAPEPTIASEATRTVAIAPEAVTPTERTFFASAEATAETASAFPAEPRQQREPALLAIVKALVERVHRVSQFLQRRSGICHRRAALTQALRRIDRRARAAATTTTTLRHRSVDAIAAQLRKFARRLLEGGPIPFLVGVQHQAGLQRGEPRFSKRAQVFRARARALQQAIRPSEALLREHQRSTADRKGGRSGYDCFPHRGILRLDYVARSRNREDPRSKLKLG
jgi:hypothetical protein